MYHGRFSANVTSYTDVMLQSNTTYRYRVEPVNVFDPEEDYFIHHKRATTPAQ